MATSRGGQMGSTPPGGGIILKTKWLPLAGVNSPLVAKLFIKTKWPPIEQILVLGAPPTVWAKLDTLHDILLWGITLNGIFFTV